jgi:hypothetical protein
VEDIMNTFVHAVDNQLTTTENGMPAFVSTTNASVDFLFKWTINFIKK